MQKKLDKLYCTHLRTAFKTVNAAVKMAGTEAVAHPILISIPKSYESAKLRIMFFGQETNGWHNRWTTIDVTKLEEWYDEFFCNDACYSRIPGSNYRPGPFWHFIKAFKKALIEARGDSVGLIWNNLIKLGKATGRGRPLPEIVKAQQFSFNIIAEEIWITKSDVVLFFSGPNYDDIINVAFPNAKHQILKNWSERELARIVHNALPKRTFRTYHPNFLFRNDYRKYLDELVSLV